MQINNTNEGAFIAFEGIDCSGKSTQIQMLHTLLVKHGYNVVSTKEPGGTEFANHLRTILKNSKYPLSRVTELLSMMTSRRDHMDKVIKPALEKGSVVLCDRFYLSTIAYQDPLSFIAPEDLKMLENLCFDNLYPDLTIIFDISIAEFKKRSKERDQNQITDRFEIDERIKSSHKIYSSFKQYPHSSKPIVHIDAEHTKGDIFLKILNLLKPLGISLTHE